MVMILMNDINESSTTKNVADLSCKKDKKRAVVFRWLDSYAGLNLIRFNGTCV